MLNVGIRDVQKYRSVRREWKKVIYVNKISIWKASCEALELLSMGVGTVVGLCAKELGKKIAQVDTKKTKEVLLMSSLVPSDGFVVNILFDGETMFALLVYLKTSTKMIVIIVPNPMNSGTYYFKR